MSLKATPILVLECYEAYSLFIFQIYRMQWMNDGQKRLLFILGGFLSKFIRTYTHVMSFFLKLI
jgi:hypothetical protein